MMSSASSQKSAIDARAQRKAAWPLSLRVLSPPWLLAAGVGLSALAWALPWNGSIHRGFEGDVGLGATAALVLAGWYVVILAAGAVGFELGRKLPPFRRIDSFPAETYYRYFTIAGATGVAYTYGTVVVRDPTLIAHAIRDRRFNEVRLALGYGAGVQTLRYAAILGGGVALYEVCFRSKLSRLAALNLTLLFLAAAAASRLSLLMAILIAVGLAAKNRESVTRFALRILILGLTGFVLLTLFNYLRNANFYEANYGTKNPLVMNLDESVAYLGAPFQASAAMAGRAAGDQIDALGRQLIPNPSLETGIKDWVSYDGGTPPSPTLARIDNPTVVSSGTWALRARLANPSKLPHDKYVWVSDRAAVEVATGDRFLLRAYVGGSASPRSPIRLGVRIDDGSVTQQGLVSEKHAITLARTANKQLLEGVYTAPPTTATIQLAIWKEGLASHRRTAISLDGVSLIRLSTVPLRHPSLLHSLTTYLVPTYLEPHYRDVQAAENDYRRYTRIEATLTTNSALAAMFGSLGAVLAFVVVGLASLLAAAFAGHASRYRSHFFISVFVISYAFAELWRVYLFNYGIIQFLLVLLVAAPLGHPWLKDLSGWLNSRTSHALQRQREPTNRTG